MTEEIRVPQLRQEITGRTSLADARFVNPAHKGWFLLTVWAFGPGPVRMAVFTGLN